MPPIDEAETAGVRLGGQLGEAVALQPADPVGAPTANQGSITTLLTGPGADRNRQQARALFEQLLDRDIEEARAVFKLFVQYAEEAGLVARRG